MTHKKICENKECGKEFETNLSAKICCCIKCVKRKNVIRFKESGKEKLYRIMNPYLATPEQKKRWYEARRKKLTSPENREKTLKTIRKLGHKYYRTPQGRLTHYKASAKTRGVSFELKRDFFLKNWNGTCYYCGDSLIGIGIDRLNPDIGYLESNVVPCCPSCNYGKLKSSPEQFISMCVKVAQRHGPTKRLNEQFAPREKS